MGEESETNNVNTMSKGDEEVYILWSEQNKTKIKF